MQFSLSEEQQMIIDTSRKVGEAFGLDYWRKKDAEKAYPSECWQAMIFSTSALPIPFTPPSFSSAIN